MMSIFWAFITVTSFASGAFTMHAPSVHALNPLSPQITAMRSVEALFVGDLPRAEILSQQAYQVAPLDPIIHNIRRGILTLSGRRLEYEAIDQAARENAKLLSRLEVLFSKAVFDPTSSNLEAYTLGVTADAKVSPFRPLPALVGLVFFGLLNEAFELIEGAIAIHPAERLWTLWNGNTVSGGGTDYLLTPYLRQFQYDPRFLPLCHKLGLCIFWASSGLWPDFIEEAADREALQARVRALAGVGQ